jgi:hypothetical protein
LSRLREGGSYLGLTVESVGLVRLVIAVTNFRDLAKAFGLKFAAHIDTHQASFDFKITDGPPDSVTAKSD